MTAASRAEAVSIGAKRYNTGKPCKHGHIADRLVSNMVCQECAYKRFRKFYARNREKMHDRRKKWHAKHGAKVNAEKRKFRAENPEIARDKARRTYANNPNAGRKCAARFRKKHPEKASRMNAKWKRNNRAYATALEAQRRAVSVMPCWPDPDAIAKIYEKAKRLTEQTGIDHEVDHIVPLKGKFVTGLHIESNLQILTATQNRRKGNRFLCEYL